MSKPVVNKSSRVQSNLLQQNCFIRDVTRAIDLKVASSVDSSYLSLDEEVSSEGVKIVKKPVPYHITPDFVSSFADSADYRRDPANAVANGVSRRNLADCTDFQKIVGMDSAAQYELYNQLKTKFSKSNSNNNTVVANDSKSNLNRSGDNNG